MKLGERIKALRGNRPIYIIAASADPPIAPSNWSAIEHGHQTNPRIDTLRRIAGVLGVDIKELLEGVE